MDAFDYLNEMIRNYDKASELQCPFPQEKPFHYKPMKNMLVFDMDGTIADLYNVPGWLDKLRRFDPSPYAEAKPMVDMDKLREVLLALVAVNWEIRIVSWLFRESSPEYDAAVRKAKKDWLKRYKFPANKIHIVAHGTTKAKCVRKYAGYAILIDDNEKVRKGWTLGDTINPCEENIIKKLEELL